MYGKVSTAYARTYISALEKKFYVKCAKYALREKNIASTRALAPAVCWFFFLTQFAFEFYERVVKKTIDIVNAKG